MVVFQLYDIMEKANRGDGKKISGCQRQGLLEAGVNKYIEYRGILRQ